MAKYYGIAGYADQIQVRPGVWEDSITEKVIYGDIIRNIKNTENPGQVNDNIKINSQISFIADPYAMENFHKIKYITYMGSRWSISSVEVQYPRLLLNLGGIYNTDEEY